MKTRRKLLDIEKERLLTDFALFCEGEGYTVAIKGLNDKSNPAGINWLVEKFIIRGLSNLA